MSRKRQVPKGGFRFAGRRVNRAQLEALERIAAVLERLEEQLGGSEPGGVRGAAGHGPPLPSGQEAPGKDAL